MAPTKRPRPAFSPPRPGKSKAKSTASKPNGTSKAATKQRRQPKTTAPKRSRLTSPTPSATNSDVDESSDEEQEDHNDSDGRSPASASAEASPEPDFILAEVSHDATADDDEPAVALPLIHRIMQEHWQDKEKTKISTDARQVVGKYVEIFVREAIMRSAYERKERDGDDAGGNDAWLEVEDLERVAPQLCLDF